MAAVVLLFMAEDEERKACGWSGL